MKNEDRVCRKKQSAEFKRGYLKCLENIGEKEIRQEARKSLIEEIEKRLQDFRVGVKKLEENNSPIQILDTSKNFFIQKILPLKDNK
jgi:2-hydroxy-3-keto-5-methylthiopentenyl-1-phosphate phosphatase